MYGRGVADRDPQNIWSPRKKLQVFRTGYVVGTLTNNANISVSHYLLPYRLSTESKTHDLE